MRAWYTDCDELPQTDTGRGQDGPAPLRFSLYTAT